MIVVFIILWLWCSTVAQAQTVVADRVRLNTGPCTLSSGAGSPEGIVVARPCDTYIDTVSGTTWEKWTGTGNSGWFVGHNANTTINGTTTLSGNIGTSNFVSQLTGWRITSPGGSADFRNLYADEMHVRTFTVDLEQALAGLQIVATSVATLAASFTCPAPGATTSFSVNSFPGYPGLQVFRVNDWVSIRQFDRLGGGLNVADCMGQVVTPLTAGAVQSWTFVRGAGGNAGAATTGAVIQVGAIVLDYGPPEGSGYYEVNAIDGILGQNAPYAQTVTWSGSPVVANRSLRTRTGNLRGVTGVANEFGLIAYGPPEGLQGYFKASNFALEARNMDFSMYAGATEVIRMNHTVPSIAIGAAVPASYAAGTGIWMGNDSGVYKFRVGNPAGSRLTWDGANLQVVGDGGGMTNINGQNIQTGTITADKAMFGSGLNQVRNSDCRVSTDDWAYYGNTGMTTTLSFGMVPWNLNNDVATCFVVVNGTPPAGTITGAYLAPTMPVLAGNRYEASAYLGVHRSGPTVVYLQWFDVTGAFVGQTPAGTTCTAGNAGGQSLAGYCRSVILGAAPATATQSRMVIQTVHTGESTPYVFFVHTMFGQATANQAEASPWGPAGLTEIIGGIIKTQSITAEKLNVTQLSAISANLGIVNVGILNGVVLNGITINGAEMNAAVMNAGTMNGGTINGVNINGVNVTGSSNITGGAISGSTISGSAFNGGSFTGGTISIGSGSFLGGFNVNGAGATNIGALDASSVIIHGLLQLNQSAGGGVRHLCVTDSGFVYAGSC